MVDKKPDKWSYILLILFCMMAAGVVWSIATSTCDDLEKDIMNAMLRSEMQNVGIFKISKTEDGKNLITLGE